MTYVAPNSVQARDIASIVHPQTNLARHLEEGPVVMSRGQGIYVWDDFGTQFLDAAAGLWCASLGYASERLARVAYEQMRKLGYAHLYRGTTNEPGVDLAEKLLQIAPVPMSKVLFQCSGSEANDTAIKLVWYYHAAIGKPAKRKIIGRRMGYHGSTSASISASGKADMHADFGLPFPDFCHTEYPHYYRLHEDGESEEQFATRMADALETLIIARRSRHGRRLHCRAGNGCGRRADAAAHLLGEDAGGAAQIRRAVHRRRGDLRLRPHRQHVGQPDLRSAARHDFVAPRRCRPACSRSRRC